MTEFTTKGNPTKTGVYMVDRGPLGTPCRYFDAATDTWSLCVYGYDEAVAVKDIPTAIGFLPWKGPIKAPVATAKADATAALVAGSMKKGKTLDLVASGPSKKALKVATVGNTKVGLVQAKAPKVKTAKVVHADGTIFFREDRQKWVVVIDGKQPAARPTKEGVVKWLASKFPEVTPTFI
jgi:hypothetical protein